ncbi:hypothetical protein ACSBOB_02590 [Mesorhizobium sp. ASY16-5R]|uniref:hypothetical protein n=1 Tax=Mesorhizobium sp. ASY16-5R TaxID=3445772 RepID=UPI003F9F063F
MELLAGVEQHALVRLLKASFYAYPVVNALHIASIGVLFASVWLVDLRILGALRTLPEQPFLRVLRWVALGAFAGAAITGLALFSVRATEYIGLPVFLAKMCLILLGGLNLALFAALDAGRPAGRAPSAAMRLTAVLSATLWTAALFAGRFIGFA